MRKDLTGYERRMEELQAMLLELDAQLQDSSLYEEANRDSLDDLLKRQGAARTELHDLEEKWLQLSTRLEDATGPGKSG